MLVTPLVAIEIPLVTACAPKLPSIKAPDNLASPPIPLLVPPNNLPNALCAFPSVFVKPLSVADSIACTLYDSAMFSSFLL